MRRVGQLGALDRKLHGELHSLRRVEPAAASEAGSRVCPDPCVDIGRMDNAIGGDPERRHDPDRAEQLPECGARLRTEGRERAGQVGWLLGDGVGSGIIAPPGPEDQIGSPPDRPPRATRRGRRGASAVGRPDGGPGARARPRDA